MHAAFHLNIPDVAKSTLKRFWQPDKKQILLMQSKAQAAVSLQSLIYIKGYNKKD